VLKEALTWINTWESNLNNNFIKKDNFLTQATADGLKITIKSTIDIVDYLLNTCNFMYVLMAKLNQDRLEVNLQITILTKILRKSILIVIDLILTGVFRYYPSGSWTK